ncbi:MAG TPA: N-acetylmuramoyl-L-alanine amidase [Thermoanaerobaculia bacterium]|nr:N-acetylmuramoyl-L-alanine amidase [Thermoanaerobaculia bacterium]
MRRDDLQPLGGPAGLFDVLTRRAGGALPRGIGERFEVVALPGERLDEDLREGDLVIRRALGEGDLAWLTEIDISAPPDLEPGARVPLDRLVLRPAGEQVPPPAPPAAPDSPVANRFIAAHRSRYCTPGQQGSLTCQALPTPRPIRRVIIHALAVPSTARRSGVEAVVAGWQNAGREASSHYLVDRDGTITQMVREADVAFHTPGNNADTIGIEHADICNDPAPFTTRLYERSAELVRDLGARHGIVFSERTVLGHQDANPNHDDPGPFWDWEYYRLLLLWDGRDPVSRPVRVVAAVAGVASAPTGWQVGRRRAIGNDFCATRRDPWGARYWQARPAAGAAPAELTLIADERGVYSVSLWWPDVAGANPAVTLEIETACISSPCRQTASTQTVTIDQRRNFGRWNFLATVTVDGPPAAVKVRLRRDSAQPGWILCDGARLLRIATLAPQLPPAGPVPFGPFGPLGPEGDAGDTVVLDRFASDSAALTAAHRAAIGQIARTVADSQSGSEPVQSIDLTGYTDSSGDDAYNLEIGRKRAAAVETELRRQIEALSPGLTGRLTFQPSSRGESAPVASNATADGKARNRRVEVRLGRGRIEPVTATSQAFPVDSFAISSTESFEESTPPDPVLVPAGLEGREIDGTGNPKPGTFSWKVADPSVARFSPISDSQAQPNKITVFGLKPGQTALRMDYLPKSAKAAPPFDLPIVVVGIKMSLLDPEASATAGANEMTRPVGVPNGVAHRSVLVELQPAAALAGKTLEWTFVPDAANRQALPAGRSTLEREGTFAFAAGSTPVSGTSVIDATGKAAVKVNLPNAAFNRGRLVASVAGSPHVSARIELEVPGVVVIDPGHGGSRSIPDSSSNNARGVTSGVLEKTLTLDMGLKVRDALLASPRLLKVFMTRDCDLNIGGIERAVLARCKGADVFLSIHFNADPGSAATRGTSTFVRALTNGNVNRPEDLALAQRVQNAIVPAIPGGNSRGVLDDTQTQPKSLAVLNDANLGNTAAFHPTRACLTEIEFLTNAAADRQFNQAADRETLKRNVARAIAGAIVADLASQP